jgi:peptide/nickel transport system permease protein
MNSGSSAFIGSGALRIEPTSADFSGAFDTTAWTFPSTLGGLTIGKSSSADGTGDQALTIGSAIGILAGYAGGITNTAIMRTVDVFYAFPSVLLAIALSGALGAGIGNALLSLTIVFIPPIARVAESVTTQVRNRDYVEAARASGADAFTIVRVHVLGNVLGPIFVYATSLIAVSMILASGLSFLGLGVKPPEPEWGLMLNTLRTAIYVQPWVAALPGAMIFITSIAFNLLSDSLRAAMDNK